MVHIPSPPKPPPVEVVEVGSKPVPFLKPLEWIATTLRSFRERPLPSTYTTEVRPTIDLFGAHRMAEVEVATVQGALGGLEVFHTAVPAGNLRLYLSMHYTQDDVVDRALLPGVIFRTTTGFPIAGNRDQLLVPPGRNFAVRNVVVGPFGRIACVTNAMGAAARMSIVVAWIEMPVGEYTVGIV